MLLLRQGNRENERLNALTRQTVIAVELRELSITGIALARKIFAENDAFRTFIAIVLNSESKSNGSTSTLHVMRLLREADQKYWRPLMKELEAMRLSKRRREIE